MTTVTKKAEPASKTVVPCREADHAITHQDTFLQQCGHWLKGKQAAGCTSIAHLCGSLHLLHLTIQLDVRWYWIKRKEIDKHLPSGQVLLMDLNQWCECWSHGLMQTFPGFICSDAPVEKLRLKSFLLTSHTKSKDKSSSLCPAYLLQLCMYFCTSPQLLF